MPTDYVLDASAVCTLFLDDPRSRSFVRWYAERKREKCRFLAPGLLPYELANVLHREKGRTRATEDPGFMMEVVRDAVEGIEIDLDAWTRTWTWADRLTAYDASYAALAQALGATLVTFDQALARAVAEKVDVIGEDGLRQ